MFLILIGEKEIDIILSKLRQVVRPEATDSKLKNIDF